MVDPYFRKISLKSCGRRAVEKLQKSKGEDSWGIFDEINYFASLLYETGEYGSYKEFLEMYEEAIISIIRNPEIKPPELRDLVSALTLRKDIHDHDKKLLNEKVADELLRKLDDCLEDDTEAFRDIAKYYMADLLLISGNYKNRHPSRGKSFDDIMPYAHHYMPLASNIRDNWFHAAYNLNELSKAESASEAYIKEFENFLVQSIQRGGREAKLYGFIFLGNLASRFKLGDGQQFIIDHLEGPNTEVSRFAASALLDSSPNIGSLDSLVAKQAAAFHYEQAQDLHQKLVINPVHLPSLDSKSYLEYEDQFIAACSHYHYAEAFDSSISDPIIKADCEKWEAEWDLEFERRYGKG